MRKEMLQHWLAVYGHEGPHRSRETQRLARLAKSEILALSEGGDRQDDARSQELMSRLRWAGKI